MKMPSAFAALLERQRSSEQRERLHRLRSELDLQENDALWQFIALLEDHCVAIREIQPPSAAAATALFSPSAAAPAWPWLFVGLTIQTLFAAACVCVGAHFADHTPLWLRSRAATDTLGFTREVLSLPAGWLMFVFAMPCAGCAAHLGWRLRSAGEHAWGWAVLSSAVGCSVACALGLWRLL